MTRFLKNAFKGGLRLLLTPLRLWNRRRHPRKNIGQRNIEIPNRILLSAVRDALLEGHTATISVKGWSMRPFLEHLRDKVRLALPTGATIGDAVLAEICPGHYVLHRIIKVQPHDTNTALDTITLMGDGNIRGTESCLRSNLCGIVTHYIYPDREIPATDPTLMRRIRRWRRLLPLRRTLLLIYQATI